MKKNGLDYLIITCGVFIVALSTHFFLIPNDFVVGGISGLAIVINAWIPQLDIGFIMVLLNAILFTIGFLTIGPHFGRRTIYASFLLSGFVWLLSWLFPMESPLIEDRFVQLILAIVLSALGMALVFRHNASTGGTDITAKILNKYFHLDLGKGVLISDVVVTLAAFTVFDLSIVIYGLVGIFLNGLIIDFILNKFKERKEFRIITDEHEKVRHFIIHELEKGATILKGYGGYTMEERIVIMTVLNHREYLQLKKFIANEKIEAFITVTNISQTFGLGFESLIDD